MGLQVQRLWFFVVEKRLQQLCVELLQFFVFRDKAGTEYSVQSGDSVRNRNNRPLLCLAFAISQRACCAVEGYTL